MTSPGPAESPVPSALSDLGTSFDQLLKAVEDGGLDHLDTHGLVAFLHDFEQFRNRLSLVDHRALRECERRDVAGFFTHRRLTDFLSSALRISSAEASRRVRAALAVGERISALGEPLLPVRSHLAAAQRVGLVSPDQVSIIEQAISSVDLRGFDPVDILAGEQLLVEHAITFGPKDLRILAQSVVDRIDPDGTRPREDLNHARRHLTLRQHRDGSFTGDFRLTGAAGAKLSAVLSPLTALKTTSVPDRNGVPKTHLDERTYPQRMHDALDDACSRLLRSGGLPDSGGTPATLIVTIDHRDLLAQTGFGETTGGTLLSATEVLRLADQADILPAVLSRSGAVLEFGRSRRIATPTQTLALIARDVGCSFPGCTTPAEWSERHHIIGWVKGGRTDLDNLTLLCGYHHTHFLSHGWSCRMSPLGVPEWIPPRYVDRAQRPLVNARVRRRQEQGQLFQPRTDHPDPPG